MSSDEKIKLDLVPVGVRILTETTPIPEGARPYEGVSYCQAVLHATFGKELVVAPESIRICQWAPVSLGFKAADNAFERSIVPHLPAGTKGIYLAPVFRFSEDHPPDVVIIRAGADSFRWIIRKLGKNSFVAYGNMRMDETALSVFFERPLAGFSRWAIRNVNRWLNWMNGFSWWQGVTTFVFRSRTVTRWFDRLISAFMANMSICRNSTVIPYQTGRANISFFCTGGIAWGKNVHDFMTSGFPWEIYRQMAQSLVYPGSPGHDHRSRLFDRLEETASKIDTRPTGGQ